MFLFMHDQTALMNRFERANITSIHWSISRVKKFYMSCDIGLAYGLMITEGTLMFCHLVCLVNSVVMKR